MISVWIARLRRAYVTTSLAVLGLVPVAALANPEPWQLNLTKGVTPTSERVHAMHMISLWVCVGIGVLVFGAMIYAMFRFRKSKGAVPATWSHSTKLEVIWTVTPIIILIVMAWPATRLLVDMAHTDDSDMTVKVTGYQWKWRYEYVDYYEQNPGVGFMSTLHRDSNRVRQLGSGLDPASVKVGDQSTYLLDVDNPLVLPVGVKVRFVITADDVIHSWWVPVLGWKQDAIPGMVTSAWAMINEPGTYRGQCAELCGKDHGFMPIVVKALPKDEFERWLAEQQAAKAAAASAGTAQTAAPASQTQG